MDFAQFLQYLIDEKCQTTVRQMSEDSGLSYGAIHRWINYGKVPTMRHYFLLLDYMVKNSGLQKTYLQPRLLNLIGQAIEAQNLSKKK